MSEMPKMVDIHGAVKIARENGWNVGAEGQAIRNASTDERGRKIRSFKVNNAKNLYAEEDVVKMAKAQASKLVATLKKVPSNISVTMTREELVALIDERINAFFS